MGLAHSQKAGLTPKGLAKQPVKCDHVVGVIFAGVPWHDVREIVPALEVSPSLVAVGDKAGKAVNIAVRTEPAHCKKSCMWHAIFHALDRDKVVDRAPTLTFERKKAKGHPLKLYLSRSKERSAPTFTMGLHKKQVLSRCYIYIVSPHCVCSSLRPGSLQARLANDIHNAMQVAGAKSPEYASPRAP